MMERRYLKMLREDLARGYFGAAPGILLPTIPELARHYRCSVSSIRQAMEVLKSEGRLHAVAGKGSFIGPAPAPAAAGRPRLLAAVGSAAFTVSWREARAALVRRGWLPADCPDGIDSGVFLELAAKNRFAGALLAVAPEGEALKSLAAWRGRGLKIAHVWPGAAEFPAESSFDCDWNAAGFLGVAAAFRRGCTQLALLEYERPPAYWPRIRAAVLQAAASMRLEVVRAVALPDWPLAGEGEWLERERRRRELFPAALPALARLPARSGILCAGSDLVFHLRQALAHGGVRPAAGCEPLSLCNRTDHADSETGVHFDSGPQLAAALDYLTDDTLNADRIVRRLFLPTLREVPAFLQLAALSGASE